MMGTAARNLSQRLPIPQLGIKSNQLITRAVILPIRRKLMRQRLIQLLNQRLLRIQPTQQLLGARTPEHAAVLLARTADALDAAHGHGHRLGQTLQHQVERLQPEGDGGKHFARLLAHVDALVDAILGAKVLVKVDFGLGDAFEVGVDDDG